MLFEICISCYFLNVCIDRCYNVYMLVVLNLCIVIVASNIYKLILALNVSIIAASLNVDIQVVAITSLVTENNYQTPLGLADYYLEIAIAPEQK